MRIFPSSATGTMSMQHSSNNYKNMATTNQNRRKKTKGRQKIDIKPIEKKSQQQVTFSKRRNGLIKKASELSVLCGASLAIVGFSPGGKPFSFGHPDVNTVLDAYVGETMVAEVREEDVQLQQVKTEYEHSLRKLEEEEKQSAKIEELNKMRDESGKLWWDESIDNMRFEEVEDYIKGMEDLRKNVFSRICDLSNTATHLLSGLE